MPKKKVARGRSPKNSPMQNMRMAMYAIVVFVVLLAVAVLSLNSQNEQAYTLDSSADACPAQVRYSGQNSCDPGYYRSVSFKCAVGGRNYYQTGFGLERQSCASKASFEAWIERVCKCSTKTPPQAPTQAPDRRAPNCGATCDIYADSGCVGGTTCMEVACPPCPRGSACPDVYKKCGKCGGTMCPARGTGFTGMTGSRGGERTTTCRGTADCRRRGVFCVGNQRCNQTTGCCESLIPNE